MTLGRAIKKRSKELIPKLTAITLQGAIEKKYIAIAKLENEELDSTIIISHFEGTNNIFPYYK